MEKYYCEDLKGNQPLNTENNFLLLDSYRYKNIYKGLEYSDTYMFLDNIGELNLLYLIKDVGEIGDILKGEKIIEVEESPKGINILIHLTDKERTLKYFFDLTDIDNIPLILAPINNKGVIFHIIMNVNGKLIKNLTGKVSFEEDIIKKLNYYYLRFTNKKIPTIPFKGFLDEGISLMLKPSLSILEDVYSILQRLKSYKVKDSFDVIIEWRDYYRITFSGNIPNINYIKGEISKCCDIIEEKSLKVRGIPAIRYDSGLIYIYENGPL